MLKCDTDLLCLRVGSTYDKFWETRSKSLQTLSIKYAMEIDKQMPPPNPLHHIKLASHPRPTTIHRQSLLLVVVINVVLVGIIINGL